MAAPLKSDKAPVDLAAQAARPSKIRRHSAAPAATMSARCRSGRSRHPCSAAGHR